MSNRNYECPKVPARWSEVRETHPAVAAAIHAISGRYRTAEDIWQAPTETEWDNVRMAVTEYVQAGLFPAEEDGRYPWGFESINGPSE